MKQSEFKYKEGDYVYISRLFIREPHGHMIDCPKSVGKIIRASSTASLGAAYSIEINGDVLDVCYWEDDIDGLVNPTFCISCECDPCDCDWGN